MDSDSPPISTVNKSYQIGRRYKFYLALTFFASMVLYATFHAARSSWAYTEASIGIDPYFSDEYMGIFNTCFMLAYGFGLYYNGWKGDKSNLKLFLFFGGIMAFLGLAGFTFLAKGNIHILVLFCLCWILNGFGQSRGYPTSMAILGNWVPSAYRGLLTGIWGTSINIGNITGSQIGRQIIDKLHWPWEYVQITVCVVLLGAIFAMIIFLKADPRDVGLEPIGGDEATRLRTPQKDNIQEKFKHYRHSSSGGIEKPIQGIGFLEALKIPNVIRFAIAYGCLKSATYGVLFWLPDYLKTVIGFTTETSFITGAYDLGQLAGAITLGHISDKFGKRIWLIVIALYLSTGLFYFLANLGSSSSAFTFGVILFVTGMLYGGSESLLGGAVSTDLGTKHQEQNQVRAVATVIGIVDGTGALMAGIAQLIIPLVKDHCFTLFFGFCVTAALILTRTGLKEIKILRRGDQVINEIEMFEEEGQEKDEEQHEGLNIK